VLKKCACVDRRSCRVCACTSEMGCVWMCSMCLSCIGAQVKAAGAVDDKAVFVVHGKVYDCSKFMVGTLCMRCTTHDSVSVS
jgi:hypothetical protein